MFKYNRAIRYHPKVVVCLRYNKNGQFLASACGDGSVHIIKANENEIILSGHDSGINDVVWLDDTGHYLATASDDQTIRIWDVEKGVCINVLTGHDDFVFCLDSHPNQNLLVSGSYDERLKLWDSRSSNYCIQTIPAHSSPISSVCFDHSGCEILSAGTDGLMRFWDTRDGFCRRTMGLATFPPIGNAYFSPNGRFILASTLDSVHRLWDVTQVEPVVVREFTGHTNKTWGVTSKLVDIDSRQCLISGSEDGQIHMWDVVSESLLQTLEGPQVPVLCVAYNPSTRELASSCRSEMMLWSLSDSKLLL